MSGRDSEATRLRIIDAAEATFAAEGIAGARVDEIAARAGANKRMLYYYFGSKEGLYEAVLRRRLADRLEAAEVPAAAAEERLPTRTARTLDDPTYVRLLMWEALGLAAGETVVAEAERAEAARAVRERIDGPRLPGVDPGQLALAEVGLTLVATAFPQLARMLTGRDPSDPRFRADHAAALAAIGRALDAASADGPAAEDAPG